MSLSERIEHVRFTLADMCLEKNADRFSFFRLLNRVIFLFQKPLIFAICRKSDETHGYIVDRHTHGDPLYLDEFEGALRRLGMKSDFSDVPEEAVEPYAVRLFHSSFFVIPFDVIRNPQADFRKQNVEFEPISRSSTVGRVLERVFRPFGAALCELGIEEHIEKNFQEIFEATALIQAYQDDPRKYPADRETQSLMTRYERRPRKVNVRQLAQGEMRIVPRRGAETIDAQAEVRADFTSLDDLLEAETGLIVSSPALRRPGGQISNLLISRKKFDRTDLRFGAYFYGIDFFLSREQRQQFRFCCQTIDRKSLTPFPNVDADRWFWENVDSARYRHLIASLRVPLSSNVRLFPEYVLMSGASILNVDPFSRGDLGWIADSATDEEREKELRRFAILHYLLQMMAPGARRPSLLTLPIRVSGATWMAATIVVDGAASDGDPEADIVSSSEFQSRFLIYHSMMRDFENRIRRKSKAAYLQCVYDVFAHQVAVMRDRNGQSRSNAPIESGDFEFPDFEALLDKTMGLARLYPYDLVVFSLGETLGRFSELRAESLGYACKVDFGIYDGNPFFDRLRLRNFLDRKDVRRQLRNLVNAQLGLSGSVKVRSI